MNKRKLHTLLSGTITVVGIALMTGKIVFDSEPGLIPLLLVGFGIVWFLFARFRLSARDKQH